MRNPDGTLNGDLNDDIPALISGSIVRYESSSLDENLTTYDLLPIVVNKPPVIVASITDTSNPQIKPYATADATGRSMYIFPDDSVKVNLGCTISLRLQARQPDIFNVENGIPTVIPSTAGLLYVWKKDGKVITSYTLESLQSRMVVNGNSLTFVNIQPEHAGSYTCEVSNDIGTSVSEPITLEVLNLDFDSYFYKNLVLNPYGKDGTDNWESTSPDLITKPFSSTPSEEFAKPYNVDLYGYTPDMLHPRPYQIDTGVEKGFDMTKDLLKNGTYFTRTRYTYTKKGGSFLLRAYQDIDLTDIEWLIKGGVFGVEGVRALFSCYIGNGLGPYKPTDPLVDIIKQKNPKSYVGNKPRISIENFLNSGPNFGPLESAYVTIEEFANETRLPSRVLQADGRVINKTDRIVFNDPWNKTMNKYWNQQYYKQDVYGVGSLSKKDGRDMVLFAADELLPDLSRRYTYGQYVEFNKIVLDRLNPNTTKIRITLNFETNAIQLFETWTPTLDLSDEPFMYIGYDRPFKQHSFDEISNQWQDAINEKLKRLDRNKGRVETEFLPLLPDPRAMVTGLNLMLLPILTQDQETTKYYTDITLVENDTPESITPSALYIGREYDPFGRLTRRLNVSFGLNAPSTASFDNTGLIVQNVELKLKLTTTDPSTQATISTPISQSALFPFRLNSPVNLEGANEPTIYNSSRTSAVGNTDEILAVQQYYNAKYEKTGSDGKVLTASTTSLSNAAESLNDFGYIVDYNNKDRLTDPSQDIPATWNNGARYQLILAAPGQAGVVSNNKTVGLQSYFLTLNFPSSSGQNTSAILSRPEELWPGNGTLNNTALSHSINARGELNIILPPSVVTAQARAGGLGYTSNRGNATFTSPPNTTSVTASGDLITCVTGLHRNLGDYHRFNAISGSRYYASRLNKILEQLNDEVAKEEPVSQSVAFRQALIEYAYNKNRIPGSQYNTINKAFSGSLEINLSDEAFTSTFAPAPEQNISTSFVGFNQTEYSLPPHLVDITRANLSKFERPSLAAVKVVTPEAFEDGLGSPSFGEAANGLQYSVTYKVLQDSYTKEVRGYGPK